ncbi:MAG TPA: phage holin family protein [Candidatus Saccharimonadales bacterium]|nr:phage holin family protein [Candidatus Saccharimonadales bacterium]
MRRGPIGRFVISWFICGVGLWVASGLLDQRISYNDRLSLIVAGFILALVNAIIKPLVVLLSLPAILFTLGLFVVVINGLMLLLVSYIYPSLQVSGFGAAILAGMVIGLVNYLVSTILERE